jgi:hypothetical protein
MKAFKFAAVLEDKPTFPYSGEARLRNHSTCADSSTQRPVMRKMCRKKYRRLVPSASHGPFFTQFVREP